MNEHEPWVKDSLRELARARLAPCALLRMGSHSHGTWVAPEEEFGTDDVDVLAILRPDAANALGFHPLDDFRVQEGPLDLFACSWGKFVRLLVKSNPNVLGALWLPPDCEWAESDDSAFWLARRQRAAFVSKQAYQSFAGYARAQLHKMRAQAYQGYMGEKRRTLVDRFGYDTKNAAHLVRLLRMCVEFLGTGDLVVRRPDAAEIVGIKRGTWSLDRVEQEAERLFAAAERAWSDSRLPPEPDREAASRILLEGYGLHVR